jgi:hypothetical protein
MLWIVSLTALALVGCVASMQWDHLHMIAHNDPGGKRPMDPDDTGHGGM